MDANKIVGQRIKEFRLQKNWSQQKLSNRCGIASCHIGEIERGVINVTINTLSTIIVALNVSFSDFFSKLDSSTESMSIPVVTNEPIKFERAPAVYSNKSFHHNEEV